MKILKFGGKSLATALNQVTGIIQQKAREGRIIVIVSAIGDTTDFLEILLEKASRQEEYLPEFERFCQRAEHGDMNLSAEFNTLNKILEGVALLGDYHLKIKDQFLACGELISAKVLTNRLKQNGAEAVAVDSRNFFTADRNFGNGLVNLDISQAKTQQYFATLDENAIPIVTGFIAQTEQDETVTLGRNGSNYSAALLAHFLNSEELQNFTHVDGIYTADPNWVKDAQIIRHLHFDDANELATFGASILHAKTILPLLEKNIPLRILNTLNPDQEGTLISSQPTPNGIKALSTQSDVALVQLEGRGLLGAVGIDARVFSAMSRAGISVSVISQGSSERGLGFIVAAQEGTNAEAALRQEFKNDIQRNDVSKISVRRDLTVISIIGMELRFFDQAFSALVKNKIVPILFSNAPTGKNVSLILESRDAHKAVNVIHGQVFGISKKINLAIFGHGTVGGTLIKQILASSEHIRQRKNLQLNIFAIANSRKVLLSDLPIGGDWRAALEEKGKPYEMDDIIAFAEQHHLENLIAIDNTGSEGFIQQYIPLVKNGFDLVSSNKVANTVSHEFYRTLREKLNTNQKQYLYETNVGAGLPLIDTIKLLHLSGENITGIKGVFSGSLSFIFNTFSAQNRAFSDILKEAMNQGYTEPDPREDLSGNDVARKLLILARELDLENEFSDISVQNLIPPELQSLETEEFLKNLEQLDAHFEKVKQSVKSGSVLRYIGELSGDLTQSRGTLETRLVEVSAQSPLGQLKGSDSLFEIYTESYGAHPIIIQGAGAGAEVTARGVFGDILRLAGK